MFQDAIYNRHMFYKDKKYEYQRFCERIATSKSRYSPPPFIDYPFLRKRQKKHQMEKEKQEDIEYTKLLLLKKYKSMYKKHNQYHPSNLHFLSLPPSLKFSIHAQNTYELIKQNNYLGNKILKIQNTPGAYNSERTIQAYKKSKKIGDNIAENSKYKNMLLNLITPFTYEKRLNHLIEMNRKKKRIKLNIDKLNKTGKGFFINKMNKIRNFSDNNLYKINVVDNLCDYHKKMLYGKDKFLTTLKEETL